MLHIVLRMMMAAVLGTAAISYSAAQGISFESGTFDEASAKARQEGKLLFVDCYTSWCGPCKVLARNVFPNDTVGSFFNHHFVSLKVDMEKGEGPALARKYEVKAYPTLLFIDPSNGERVYQVVGARSVQGLLDEARKTISPERNLQSLAARYQENKQHTATVSLYLDALKAASLTARRDSVLQEYLCLLPAEQLCTADNWHLLSTHVETLYTPAFDYILKHVDGFNACVGSEAVEQKTDHLYRYAVMPLIYRKRMPAEAFPQERFDRLYTLLQHDRGANTPYYLTLLQMIAAVQQGDYNRMLDGLDQAKQSGILTPENSFYLIWLNLTYLKECTEKSAINRGLRWLEQIKPDASAQAVHQQAWQNMKNQLQSLSSN